MRPRCEVMFRCGEIDCADCEITVAGNECECGVYDFSKDDRIAALVDALKELGVDVIATIYRLEETIGRKPDADDMADWHDSIRRGACWQEDAQYHDALYMWMLLTGNYQPPKEAEHEN